MSDRAELPVVLITNQVPDGVMAPLSGLARVIQGPGGGDLMTREEVLTLAPQLVGIINQGELRVDAALLDRAPNLRIVANVAIGTNNLDLVEMKRRGVWATNTPDAFVEATADATLGLLLSAARRLAAGDRFVRSGGWQSFQPGLWDGVQLSGKILGIVGYGKIGQAVARRAAAFGMEILFHRRLQTGQEQQRPLDGLLATADFVSLHTPLTPETHHLFDAQRLRQMKPGAYLINMARGPVVDEEALVQVLQEGHLAGAALDVFEAEPAVHPALLQMENVVLTPHLGGGTHESRHAARLLCAQNVVAVLRDEPPLTPVTAP